VRDFLHGPERKRSLERPEIRLQSEPVVARVIEQFLREESRYGLLAGRSDSEITWSETRPFRDAGQHARPDLFVVVEGEDKVSPPIRRSAASTRRARVLGQTVTQR